MAWFLIVVAGILETGWAIGLKYTEGFTRPVPSVLTAIAMAASMYLLALGARSLPIGTAYPAWVGIGTAGTVVLGVVLFGESLTVWRLVCLGLLAAGVVGLKMGSGVVG